MTKGQHSAQPANVGCGDRRDVTRAVHGAWSPFRADEQLLGERKRNLLRPQQGLPVHAHFGRWPVLEIEAQKSPDAAPPTVLFVCTGNIFRSMTAEYALRSALGYNQAFTVRSAGLKCPPHGVLSYVKDHLANRQLDVSNHRSTVLTNETLTKADVPVAMGTEHREQVAQIFGREIPLFSQIAYATEAPLLDVWQVVPDWETNIEAAATYAREVMDYIIDGMPGFISTVERARSEMACEN